MRDEIASEQLRLKMPKADALPFRFGEADFGRMHQSFSPFPQSVESLYIRKNISAYTEKYFCIYGKIFLHIRKNIFAYTEKYFCIYGKIFLHIRKNISAYTEKYFCIYEKIFLHIRKNISAYTKKYFCIYRNFFPCGKKFFSFPSPSLSEAEVQKKSWPPLMIFHK
ncbi:hypothetical protein HQ29_06075 [Porphyromonas canoris]|nr:hypothetical protein HQ29_06075 [Porphyromonas canoris]